METQYFLTTEQYQAVKEAWKKLSDAKSIQAHDVLIYNIFRGKNPSSGFTTKKSNIQGNNPWFAFKSARDYAIWFSDSSAFKARYGIECPVGLKEKLKEAKHG